MSNEAKCKGCGKVYIIHKWNKIYCSNECYRVNGLHGHDNPFYGRKHTEETILRMKQDERFSHKGEQNPFYGKTHSQEVRETIKEKNRIWRLNNKESRIQRRMERKGLTKETLLHHWEIYRTSPVNQGYFTEVVGVDPRTFHKFLVDCEIATMTEIRQICELKQMFQAGYSISAPELKLLAILKEHFGDDNVKHQIKKFGFWFDFCLFGQILIEFDGFYYHKILINKNDIIKEKLALSNGYSFIRIEEDEKRQVDWGTALKRIREVVQQINS